MDYTNHDAYGHHSATDSQSDNGIGHQEVDASFHPEHIPNELKAIPAWAPYALVWNQKRKKFDKIPRQINKPKFYGSTKSESHWGTFQRAVQQAKANGLPGVGFCVTFAKGKVCVYDLDDCLKDDGTTKDWAKTIIRDVDSYTELSPFKKGLHIFCLGTFPDDWVNHETGIEAYAGNNARFVTVTGAFWPGREDIHEIAPSVHADIQRQWKGEAAAKPKSIEPPPDLIEGVEIPSGLPKDVIAFMATGDIGERSDRSGLLAWIAVCLLERGLSEQQALSLMVDNEYTFDVALGHRRGDYDKAVLYLWKEQILKGEATLKPVVAGDFQDFRREAQRAENRRIGQGEEGTLPTADNITLAQALQRFVLIADQQFVYDRIHPRRSLKYPSWQALYAASKVEVINEETKKPKMIPVSKLWLDDPKRKSTHTITFRAGHPEFTISPKKLPAMNTWSDFDRSGDASDPALFVSHVHRLFGDRADDFLDWLAHIEQNPGVLPHTCWLHVSPHTGTGRNWMASVLVRVWAGHVAPNLELSRMLDATFNDELSEALLAIVDEIREGGSDNKWDSTQKFKSTVNAEMRNVNKKFGMKAYEWNSCRWLMFSNYPDAIPIESQDRRVEVVIHNDVPMDSEYFIQLYAALSDPGFINGVGLLLRNRDISNFDPGRRAKQTSDREKVVNSSKSDFDVEAEDLLATWPSDVITNKQICYDNDYFDRASRKFKFPSAMRHALRRIGAEQWEGQIKIDNKPERGWLLKNVSKWRGKEAVEIADEFKRGVKLAQAAADAANQAVVDAANAEAAKEFRSFRAGMAEEPQNAGNK